MAHAINTSLGLFCTYNTKCIMYNLMYTSNSPQILHPAIKLSMLFLKMSTDGDDFTESGKAFHSSTSLTYQKIFRLLSLLSLGSETS